MEQQPVIRLCRIDGNGRTVERWVNPKSIEAFYGTKDSAPWDSRVLTSIYFKGQSDQHEFEDHPWIVASALDWALDASDFTPELRKSCDDALSGKYGWPWSMNA